MEIKTEEKNGDKKKMNCAQTSNIFNPCIRGKMSE